MKKKSVRILFGLGALLWMGLIFHFSNQPAVISSELSGGLCDQIVGKVNTIFSLDWSDQTQQQMIERLEFPLRKAAHMSEYAVLAGLVLGFFTGGTDLSRKKYLMSFVVAAGYAATDEFHQFFIPGRSAEVRDVLIDSTGALLGLLLIAGILFLGKRKKGNPCEKEGFPLK